MAQDRVGNERYSRRYQNRISDPSPTRSFLMGWVWNVVLLCVTVLLLALTVRIIIWMF